MQKRWQSFHDQQDDNSLNWKQTQSKINTLQLSVNYEGKKETTEILTVKPTFNTGDVFFFYKLTGCDISKFCELKAIYTGDFWDFIATLLLRKQNASHRKGP